MYLIIIKQITKTTFFDRVRFSGLYYVIFIFITQQKNIAFTLVLYVVKRNNVVKLYCIPITVIKIYNLVGVIKISIFKFLLIYY